MQVIERESGRGSEHASKLAIVLVRRNIFHFPFTIGGSRRRLVLLVHLNIIWGKLPQCWWKSCSPLSPIIIIIQIGSQFWVLLLLLHHHNRLRPLGLQWFILTNLNYIDTRQDIWQEKGCRPLCYLYWYWFWAPLMPTHLMYLYPCGHSHECVYTTYPSPQTRTNSDQSLLKQCQTDHVFIDIYNWHVYTCILDADIGSRFILFFFLWHEWCRCRFSMMVVVIVVVI